MGTGKLDKVDRRDSRPDLLIAGREAKGAHERNVNITASFKPTKRPIRWSETGTKCMIHAKYLDDTTCSLCHE